MPRGSLTRGAPGKPHPGWDDIPRQARGRPVLVYVRNPWDWYVSWYHAVLNSDPSPLATGAVGPTDFSSVLRKVCSGGVDPDGHPPPATGRGDDFYTTRFRRFCGEGLQSDELTFGRFERLLEDLDCFLKAAGAPLSERSMARIRTAEPLNPTQRRPYREYYDGELRDLVADSCRMLIARFGYRF